MCPILGGKRVKLARAGLLTLAMACSPVAHAGTDSWTTSKLTRFGVDFDHPASFRRVEAAREKAGFEGSISAGNTDTVTDGTMSVTLRGEPGWDRGRFESLWKGELARRGSSISYKVKRDNWYVVSGVEPDGTEFYTKCWLLPNGGFQFEASYPHTANTTCDPILERMLKGFRPTLGEGGGNLAPGPAALSGIGQHDAERIVAEKLNFKPAKNRHLLFDHVQKRDGRDFLVVHGYDLVIDGPDGSGHTATWGWYYVDARSGAAYEWDLANDKLLPVKPLRFR